MGLDKAPVKLDFWHNQPRRPAGNALLLFKQKDLFSNCLLWSSDFSV